LCYSISSIFQSHRQRFIARSWMWPAEAVLAGAVARAPVAEIRAVFERVAKEAV
jgi:hypothetical protein